MAEKKKINWLLILQGWAMLWVVIGHSGPTGNLDDYPKYALFLWNFAYSFHMPLFIAISGFLFYLTRLSNDKWTWLSTMKEKLIRFGIPFIVLTLVAMVLKSIFSSSVSRAATISFQEFFNAILYPYNGPMREFWFLGAIMWFFFLFPVWREILKRKRMIVAALIVLVIMGVYYPDTLFLSIRSACKNAFYFYLGILGAVAYQKNPSFIFNKGFAPTCFALGIVIFIIGRLYNIPLFQPLGGVTFSLALALWLDHIIPNVFFSFRNYTYQIYLLSVFAQFVVTTVRLKMGLPFTPMYVLNMIVGLYIPVIASKIIECINWTPLLLCVGLKKK